MTTLTKAVQCTNLAFASLFSNRSVLQALATVIKVNINAGNIKILRDHSQNVL